MVPTARERDIIEEYGGHGSPVYAPLRREGQAITQDKNSELDRDPRPFACCRVPLFELDQNAFVDRWYRLVDPSLSPLSPSSLFPLLASPLFSLFPLLAVLLLPLSFYLLCSLTFCSFSLHSIILSLKAQCVFLLEIDDLTLKMLN